jgi:hemolysin activation/secretion protein
VPITSTLSPGQKPQYNTLVYLPLNVGWSGSMPDPIGMTFFNAQGNFNTGGLLSDNADFARTAYTTNAQAGYITVQMGLDRVQTIYKDWSVKLHTDGQWANGALISNEQYAMGGTAGVRGYQDGQDYGDTGWRCSIEPQTPLFNIGMVGNEGHVEPCWIRGSVFMDYGELYRFQDTPGLPGNLSTVRSLRFCGTGFACTANIGSHLDGRVTVAWPLISQFGVSESVHVYFGIGAQF